MSDIQQDNILGASGVQRAVIALDPIDGRNPTKSISLELGAPHMHADDSITPVGEYGTTAVAISGIIIRKCLTPENVIRLVAQEDEKNCH